MIEKGFICSIYNSNSCDLASCEPKSLESSENSSVGPYRHMVKEAQNNRGRGIKQLEVEHKSGTSALFGLCYGSHNCSQGGSLWRRIELDIDADMCLEKATRFHSDCIKLHLIALYCYLSTSFCWSTVFRAGGNISQECGLSCTGMAWVIGGFCIVTCNGVASYDSSTHAKARKHANICVSQDRLLNLKSLFQIPFPVCLLFQDCVLTAALSKNSCRLRCFVVTVIAIPSNSQWIKQHPLLHPVNGDNGERILASRTHIQNVDSKPLFVSPKGLHRVEQKEAGQTKQLQHECLQSGVQTNHTFGLNLLQCFRKNGSLNVNARQKCSITILGQYNSHTSQQCSSSSLHSESSSSSAKLVRESSKLCASVKRVTKETNAKEAEHYANSNSGALTTAHKDGAQGFNLSRLCIAEAVLVSRARPIPACEFLNAPVSSFSCNCRNNVDINASQMSSLPSLGEANDLGLFPAYIIGSITSHSFFSNDIFTPSSALITGKDSSTECFLLDDCLQNHQEEKHILSSVGTFIPSKQNLTSNPQIEEPINLKSEIHDRNCGQPLDFKVIQAASIHASSSYSQAIVKCCDQSSTENDQLQLDQPMDTKVNSFAGQNGYGDRNGKGIVNTNSDSKFGITGGGVSCFCGFVSGTGSASTHLTTGSNKICHRIGARSGGNCGSGIEGWYQCNNEVGKAKDIKVANNDERGKHNTGVLESREAHGDSHQSRRLKCNLEHHAVRGKKVTGNATASESSSSGRSSFGHMNSYSTVGRGSSYCVWKKVQKNPGDDRVNETKATDHAELQSGKVLQDTPHSKSLSCTLSTPPKLSQECDSWECSHDKQYLKESDDHKERSSLWVETALDNVSSKFYKQVELPRSQPLGEDSAFNLQVRAKEKQNMGKLPARVMKTGKVVWARKVASSQSDDSKPFSQKEDADLPQKSIHPKSIDINDRNPQYTLHSKAPLTYSHPSEEPRSNSNSAARGHGYTMQVSRDVFSSLRSNAEIQSSSNHMVTGTSKSVNQAKQQANHMKSLGQLATAHPMGDEGFLCSPLWKGRTTTIAEKGLSRERNNERHRSSQQVSQKWVPVESKSTGAVKATATKNVKADVQGNLIACRTAKEGVKEDESSRRSLASSPDSYITNASAKTSNNEGAATNDQSHAQTERLGSAVTIQQETETQTKNSDHAENAVPEARYVSDSFYKSLSMVVNDASSPVVESNQTGQTRLRAVHASFEYQMVSERIAHTTGSPLSEFEKVLHAMSPIILPLSDNHQCCNYWRNPLAKSLICNCQVAKTPLKNIWQWYEEPGNYGLEVKAQDLQHPKRPGMEGNLFRAYFVPFLSGMQLFGLPSTSQTTNCTGAQNCVEQERNNQFENVPILSALLPKPTAEDAGLPKCLVSGLDSLVCDGNHACSCHTSSENFQLLFEFFESEQPHQRRPLFDKIRELTGSNVGSSFQLFGDPQILSSIKIGDLHPASWFAVAWYPIYRVPEGHLRTAFLTYHSLGRFAYRAGCSNPLGNSVSSIVAPVVGLQSYSSQVSTSVFPKAFGTVVFIPVHNLCWFL
eukprot:Gb_26875 [translate_table: standard]